MPSIPRTRPAGVRRAATGVVSGVGGAGSGDRACVACSECFAFEQPAPDHETAAASNRHATRFTFFHDSAWDARPDFVARRVSAMTDFDASRATRKCKSLKCNEEKALPLMVWRLILSVPRRVPAWEFRHGGELKGSPLCCLPQPSGRSTGSPSEQRLRAGLLRFDETRE